MDFKSFKEKALEKAKQLKEKTIEIADKTVDGMAKKLGESGFTISSKKELDEFIKKSAETSFKNKETWVEKKYSHRALVIFGDEKSDFFQKALVRLPVLAAKAFTQNTSIKLAKSDIKEIDLKKYKIKTLPSLIVFENEKFLKVIEGEENILKLVKSLSLDINKSIDEFDSKKNNTSPQPSPLRGEGARPENKKKEEIKKD